MIGVDSIVFLYINHTSEEPLNAQIKALHAVNCLSKVVLSPFEFFTNTQGWQFWHYCQRCIPIYLQFSSLFTSIDVSKCEIRNQGVGIHMRITF